MHQIVDYLIKVSICLSVVVLFYHLFLRRLTFYNWNRWYFLGYTLLSFLIPLINIMPQLQKQQWDQNLALLWVPALATHVPATQPAPENHFNYWHVAIGLLLVGSLVFFIRFLIKYHSFIVLKRNASLIQTQFTNIYQSDAAITPFSFGKAIFINSHLHTEEELKKIIRHEFVHVQQKHTVDIIWCEWLVIFNWYNPFVWLLQHALKQNLEFIADQQALRSGIDKQQYQYLLLRVLGSQQFSFTSPFNFSSLKKRIIMMNSLKSARVKLLKFLFLLPVVAVLLLAFRKESEPKPAHYLSTVIVADTSLPKFVIITSTGDFDKDSSQRYRNWSVVEKVEVGVWDQNKQFYQKKYGDRAGSVVALPLKSKNTAEMKPDHVYVLRAEPQDPDRAPLVLVDGRQVASLNTVNPQSIESVSILKENVATDAYGDKGKNGVILIVTKGAARGLKSDPSGKMVLKGDSIVFYNQNNENVVRVRGRAQGQIINRQPADTIGIEASEITAFGKRLMGSIDNLTVVSDKPRAIDASERATKNNPMHEIVVVGYPKPRQTLSLNIRPGGELSPKDVLYIIDGKKISHADMQELKPDQIESITVLKGVNAAAKYGEIEEKGVIEITTKKAKE